MSTNERGQALPLMLVAVALAAVVMMAVAGLAQRAATDAQARAEADAAALGGAAAGRADALALAEANGAELVDYATSGSRESVSLNAARSMTSSYSPNMSNMR